MFLFKAVLTTLLISSFAYATQIFSNKGILNGWDYDTPEYHGTVEEVTNVFYEGPTAIKVTQTYDPNYTGQYHSEIRKNNVYKKGDTGFYGFAFRLSQEWEFEQQSYSIGQFI